MVSLDFGFPTRHLYGLPHRADSFILRDTKDSDPLQLHNKDWFKHPEHDEAVNLYGSIPYITSHSASRDASLLWNNAAETWVDNLAAGDGRITNFMSISGQIDFVMFGSEKSPK